MLADCGSVSCLLFVVLPWRTASSAAVIWRSRSAAFKVVARFVCTAAKATRALRSSGYFCVLHTGPRFSFFFTALGDALLGCRGKRFLRRCHGCLRRLDKLKCVTLRA
jgi:hypothetical protein